LCLTISKRRKTTALFCCRYTKIKFLEEEVSRAEIRSRYFPLQLPARSGVLVKLVYQLHPDRRADFARAGDELTPLEKPIKIITGFLLYFISQSCVQDHSSLE
jgi:hypothetical protein